MENHILKTTSDIKKEAEMASVLGEHIREMLKQTLMERDRAIKIQMHTNIQIVSHLGTVSSSTLNCNYNEWASTRSTGAQ